ncbi:Hsp20/alpha crystallin family protein [Pedobacter sp. WC2423]|uniref:Hsp20/alpha crystallin family protein n=1 Tax=Pedobacter sp. WC2423 TaxID=3234142 RepID=UPI0034661F81
MTLVKLNAENKKKNVLIPGFNDVFDSIINDTFFSDRLLTRVPAANISESPDHFHLELAAPGLNKEDFKLNLERNVLSVTVEKQPKDQQNQKHFTKREYSYTSFVRSFSLPESADENNIQAKYAAGILTIEIPKKEEAKTISRQIEIQ